MTEPNRDDRHNVDANSNNNTNNTSPSDRSGRVTAARRHGNLETIRKQPGWKEFPDCIPLAMRTTKSGKVTEFGNTKLRIIERVAVHTNFVSALTYLKSLTEDGTRLLSLKDLEQCAAHFDRSKKSTSSQRGSSSAPASTSVSHAGDEEPSYHSLAQPLDTWNHFTLDQSPMPSNAGPSLHPLKRPSPESFQSMSVSPVDCHPKRPRMDTFFDGHSADFLFDMNSQNLSHTNSLSVPGYQHQDDRSMRVPSPNLLPQSPSQNPARALLSIHPHAGSIFSNLNTAFDDLLARVEDQQQLVKSALDQLRMATNGLEVAATTSTPNNTSDRDLETAQRKEARARQDLQQARSARDVIDIQYGHIGTSLSRALVDTVRAEYTRAEAAMNRAQADVEAVRQRLHNANNREQGLRRAKEVAEVGIDQLQRQTRFWLKRLAEAGVKLTDQLGTLQGSDAGQATSQM
ncbi:hypothetical protein D6D24_05750 [Aureobasidium pullulans]|uniref:Uncharacterized protein n=1 Tax=Aureobasidium pullulans TaxID=5580 RepID=A0A4S8VP81_AURPU|nr:hypothetical protein D6D24_05750 [Aureobasidium pullulans]